MTTLFVLAAVAAGSYVVRILFVQLVPAERLPVGLREQLSHLGPAVLGALTATAVARVATSDGRLDPVAALAVVAAAVVGWRTGSLGWLLAAGVAVAVTAEMLL